MVRTPASRRDAKLCSKPHSQTSHLHLGEMQQLRPYIFYNAFFRRSKLRPYDDGVRPMVAICRRPNMVALQLQGGMSIIGRAIPYLHKAKGHYKVRVIWQL